MVVATSATAALEAAEAIDIDYEPLEPILNPKDSEEVAVIRHLGDAAKVGAAFDEAGACRPH